MVSMEEEKIHHVSIISGAKYPSVFMHLTVSNPNKLGLETKSAHVKIIKRIQAKPIYTLPPPKEVFLPFTIKIC